MKKTKFYIYILSCLVLVQGCSFLKETYKTVWGSSTRALEEARADGMSGVFQCSFKQCYHAVLSLQRPEPIDIEYGDGTIVGNPWDEEEGIFDVFLKSPVRRYIVVMGVSGQVDTTEVGIFFDEHSYQTTKVEVASLSSSAKRKIAQAVFDHLSLQFKQID